MLFKSYFYFYQFNLLKTIFLHYPKIILKSKMDFLGNDLFFCYYIFTNIKFLFLFLSNSSLYRFKLCSELTLIDTLNSNLRFLYFITLLSISFNKRFSFMFKLLNNFYSLYSLTSIFYSSNWLEREIYDMFGFTFINHPNLRRILTDYGFSGFPLKKDYPLFGFKDIYFSIFLKKIKYISI